MRRTYTLSSSLVALLCALSQAALADQVGGELGVRLTVIDSCVVQAGDAQSAVSVLCSTPGAYRIDQPQSVPLSVASGTQPVQPVETAAPVLTLYW